MGLGIGGLDSSFSKWLDRAGRADKRKKYFSGVKLKVDNDC